MIFQATAQPGLYISASGIYDPTTGPWGLLFFLLPNGGGQSPPPTISTSDAWNTYTTGIYIFVNINIATSTSGLAALVTAVTAQIPAQTRWCWFSVPDYNGAANGTVISTLLAIYNGGSWYVGTTVNPQVNSVTYRNIVLTAGSTALITYDDGAELFTIRGGSSTISVDGGTTKMAVLDAILIGIDGQYRGRFRFRAYFTQMLNKGYLDTLDVGIRYFINSGGGTGSSLVSVRYPIFVEPTQMSFYGSFDPFYTGFAPASVRPTSAGSSAGGGTSKPSAAATTSTTGTTAATSTSTTSTSKSSTTSKSKGGGSTGGGTGGGGTPASTGPAPNDLLQTYFALLPQDIGAPSAVWPPPSTPLRLTVTYSNALGTPLTVLPQWGTQAPQGFFACLVLAVNPADTTRSPQGAYSLTPMGSFYIDVSSLNDTVTSMPGNASHPALRMLLGFSGTEYLALTKAGTAPVNYLTFFAGMPGTSSTFTPNPPSPAPTTSWITVNAVDYANQSNPLPLTYYAQPEQSTLYSNMAVTSGGTLTTLSYQEIPVATLSPTAAVGKAFPAAPYAGVPDMNVDQYQTAEYHILAPARRQTIYATGTVRTATDGGAVVAATPRGLLASLSTDLSVIDSLALANTASGELTLTGIPCTTPLYAALMTNQLFLVITDPATIAPYLVSNPTSGRTTEITIDGWTFDLTPTAANWLNSGNAGTKGTMLILKYHALPIAELAADIGTWAQGSAFNTTSGIGTPAGVSKVLTAIIADAVSGIHSTDSDYAQFREAVTDPNWNGVLVISCEAPLSELPDQLKGLASGIDPSLFFAHHVGIQASAVADSSGSLSLVTSSTFGLINYQAPAPLVDDGQPFQFQVEQLKVLFLNSAVAAFASIIDLQVNELFGEPATLEGASDNIVRLYGVYQKHEVNGVVEESYTFQTATGQSSVFDMTSSVLNAVELSRGEFATVTSDTTATQTDSQFIFWGTIDFKALSGFDLFSFGRESGVSTPSGLNFGNLIVDKLDDTTVDPPVSTFTFDAAQLSIDLAASIPRAASFFAHFPLTVSGFTQAKLGTAPTDQGYMGLQTPLSQSTLDYPWYSLNFNVNLGSPGGLAAKIDFVAGITVAWAPNLDGGYTIFTGLKLPGSSGAKRAISLQGIFEITFKTLEVLVSGTTYILVLYNIGFEFLSLTFPPNAQINFLLFGDPNASGAGSADPNSRNTNLGWYAAYQKNSSTTSGGTTSTTQNQLTDGTQGGSR